MLLQHNVASPLLLGVSFFFFPFSSFTELKTTLCRTSLYPQPFPALFYLFIYLLVGKGRGKKKKREKKKKKVWFLLQRAFPNSGHSFTLNIMDEHCSPVFHAVNQCSDFACRQCTVFHDSLNSRSCVEYVFFRNSVYSFGPTQGGPCVLVFIRKVLALWLQEQMENHKYNLCLIWVWTNYLGTIQQ